MTDEDTHRFAAEVTRLLTHLIAAALIQDEAHAREARQEALRVHAAVREYAQSVAPSAVRLDGLWSEAVAALVNMPGFAREALRASSTLPTACPVAMSDLIAPGLAVFDLEERIRGATSTG